MLLLKKEEQILYVLLAERKAQNGGVITVNSLPSSFSYTGPLLEA